MAKQGQKKDHNAESNFEEWDQRFQLMPWWDKEKVQQAKVMVVGAGALGNEVLKNLALLNFGHLFIVDFDQIAFSNLSRSILYREDDCGRNKCEAAAERIKQINNNVKTQALVGDIQIDVGLGVLRRMDVIIGCLDNRLARLHLNRACYKVNKTWIDGGIRDLGVQVSVFKPQKTCYECSLTTKDREWIAHQVSCWDIASSHELQGHVATTPIAASIAGAMQAQEALKEIHGQQAQQMLNESFYYEGYSNVVLQRAYPKLKKECPSHFSYTPIIESPLSCEMTIADTLKWLGNFFEEQDISIALDHVLALEVTTKESEITSELVIPQPQLKKAVIKRYQHVPDEDLIITRHTQALNHKFPHQALTLRECGIPPLQIIRVLTEKGEFFVELSGDEPFIHFQ